MALDVILEPKPVLLSDLNLDLLATAATACARVMVPNANSSLPSKGWGLFTCAGTDHPTLTSALAAPMRDAAARADEDMQSPEVHEQSGAVIGLTSRATAKCEVALLPVCGSRFPSPVAAHMDWRLSINAPFRQGGVKTLTQSPPLLSEGEAPPLLISRRLLELVKPSSAALRQGGQHPQMLLSCKSSPEPSPRQLPGTAQGAGQASKRRRNVVLGRDGERGCCFLLFLALFSAGHNQGCRHSVQPGPSRPYAAVGTDVTKPHRFSSPAACKGATAFMSQSSAFAPRTKGPLTARLTIAFGPSLQQHSNLLLGRCCERDAQQQEGLCFAGQEADKEPVFAAAGVTS